jgi:hypothetical protein
MSNPSEGGSISGAAPGIYGDKNTALLPKQWFAEATSRHNMTLLAMVSGFLASVDTLQSFYLQRVVNQFNEVNLLPLKFYSRGFVGYLLYAPIDFLALYATLIVLWIWASYFLWYSKRFIFHRFV